MMLVTIFLLGALSKQEAIVSAPNPETLMRVTRYERFMFQDAEVPFTYEQRFIQESLLPDAVDLEHIARGERMIIEVCRPSRTGASGQWLWPVRLLERRRQCVVYGVSDERLP